MKKLIIAILFSLLISCSYHIPPRMKYHIASNYAEDEAYIITEGLYRGMDKILNCDYLIENYYSNWTKAIVLQQDGVTFKSLVEFITNQERYSEDAICGLVSQVNYPNTIFLSENIFYNGTGCPSNFVIAHELLHIIGFHHNTVEEKDVFNTVARKCEIVYVKSK